MSKKNSKFKLVLGNEYDSLVDFFTTISEREYDYLIFISRRCYILFQYINEMEKLEVTNFASDLGIFAIRNEIAKCKRIAIIDDIGNTGTSMHKVYNKVETYCGRNCKIIPYLFVANRKYGDKPLQIQDGLIKRKVSVYQQLTDRKSQSLSYDMVAAVLNEGIPYSTFVYFEGGRLNREGKNLYEAGISSCEDENTDNKYELLTIDTKDTLLNEYKWKTKYINVVKNSLASQTSQASQTIRVYDFACVRMYMDKNNEDNIAYFMPFTFLHDIEESQIFQFYEALKEVVKDLKENTEFEQEISSTLSILNKNIRSKKNRVQRSIAIQYLACMLSCLSSKLMLNELNLSKCFCDEDKKSEYDKYREKSLQGSFSDKFMNVLTCNNTLEAFLKTFSDKLKSKITSLNNVNYVWKNEYCELAEYVKNNIKRDIYFLTVGIFEKMREKYQKSGMEEDKRIPLAVIIQIFIKAGKLKSADPYNKDTKSAEEVIQAYLAQIECWDRGISTYRFRYEEGIGLIAVCEIGEISSLIREQKYQKTIEEFYKSMLSTSETMNKDLEMKLLEEAIRSNGLQSDDRKELIREFNENQGYLYHMIY